MTEFTERDYFYLTHMLECIESIERYAKVRELDSELISDAILRKLQLLTESSKRVSVTCKAAHPEVRWNELAGFRNVVVHDYLGIRIERILPIVQQDIPQLRNQIQGILNKYPRT